MFLYEGRTVVHNGNDVVVLAVIKKTKQVIVEDVSNPKKSYLVNRCELCPKWMVTLERWRGF